MKIFIREAGEDDWEIVQKIGKTVFEATQRYDSDLDMDYPYSEEGVKYYKSVIISPKGCAFIAEVDGIPVGYLVGGEFKYPYRKVLYGEIQDMGIMPDYRRLGIGSMLVAKFREWCKSVGYKKMYVNTYYDDERAVGFYKKQGMIPTDLILIGKV